MADLIETGEARPDELERILEVMCESFEMPHSVARAIYYADPYLDHRRKRVVRVNGEIVSCLTVVDANCRIGRAVVRLAGIAGLATRPAYRRRGFAGMLLKSTLAALVEQGVTLSALFPFSRHYYRRFGWETCGVIWRCVVPATALPRFGDDPALRRAQWSDIPALDRLYHSRFSTRNLSCVRDAARWRYILDHTPEVRVCAPQDGPVTAYLLHGIRPGATVLGAQQGMAPTLRVREMVAADVAARRSLMGYMAAHCPVGGIEYDATWDDLAASGLLDFVSDHGGIRVEQRAGVMARVLDLPRLATHLRDDWTGFQGKLELVIADPILHAMPQAVRISGDGHGTPVIEVPTDAAEPAVNRLTGHVRDWTQILVGARSLPDAVSLGLVHATGTGTIEMAAHLFPPGTSFLPIPDYF